jgi:hypothetical protein
VKWQAVHFFKQPSGLSRNEPVEMAACLDYEQALESKRLVDVVCSLSSGERQWMLSRALQSPSRFVWVRRDSSLQSQPFRSCEDLASFPPIPAVCVAASWFPKHWLEAPASTRPNVVGQIRQLYSIDRLGMFPFPLDPDELFQLTASVNADPDTTLHVIAIDRTQARSAIVQKFKRWLEQEDIKGTRSRKGKVNVPACLDDLACYRLSSLDQVARETVMAETGFHRSVARLSNAKHRALKRLQALKYI